MAAGVVEEIEHDELSPVTGVVDDDDLRHLLEFACRAWENHKEPGEGNIEETEWWQSRVERAASDTATEAVRVGNVSQMEYITGMPEYVSDVSGLHAIYDLERWLLDSEKCKVVYLADHMGSGKTESVHLFADVIKFRSERRQDLKEPEFSCNVPSSDMPTITDWTAFREWVEDGNVGDNRWFFFDEGSQALTGYSGDREEVEKLMSKLVKLARKYGVNIVIVGHTGMDLHADLRRLADYVEKPSLKKLRVYASVNSGEGEGHLLTVDGLPEAREHGFETDDLAPWSWGGALDDDDSAFEAETVKRMLAVRAANVYQRSDDITQGDAAELLSGGSVDISRYMVQQAASGAYDDEEPA